MMMVESKKKVEQEQAAKARYTKEQLIAAKRYAGKTDALRVVLRDGKSYTLIEADGMIEKFMKGKVK